LFTVEYKNKVIAYVKYQRWFGASKKIVVLPMHGYNKSPVTFNSEIGKKIRCRRLTDCITALTKFIEDIIKKSDKK
jgi:hypothetical protein